MADKSSANQKGRADAAKGEYHPPGYGVFDSHETVERKLVERGEYEEGRADKKNEIKKDK